MLTTIVIVMVIYFGVMTLLGILGKKHTATFESYLNIARSAGPMMVVCSAVGTHIGNGFVVGGASDGASIGLGGAVYGLGCALSYVVVALTVSDFLYKRNCVSLADYLSARYGDKITSVVYDVSTTLSYIGNVGAQLMAGYALFEALGLNGMWGVIIIAVVVLIYSQVAGLWGSFATSVLQTLIILVALVLAAIVITTKGAFEIINDAVQAGQTPDGFYDLVSMSIPAFIGLTIPTSISTLVDQCVFQRINASRSAATAKWGHVGAGLLLVPLAFLPTFIGMYGRAAYGAEGDTVFFDVLLNDLPPVIAAIAVCAVLAAVMSTISGMYNSFTTTIIKDIYRDMINPKADDKLLYAMSTGLSIITTTACVLIALFADSIIGLLTATYTFIGAACLIPFLGGILWKGANAKGAVASSVAGVFFCLLDMVGIINPTYESLFPLVPALIAFVIVSLATRKGDPAQSAAAE